ncbi:MAG: hypothetical protein JW874_04490 [Spirochaetales bacterium]|nr:hypothetical protein [Spirochaetales bacterium]
MKKKLLLALFFVLAAALSLDALKIEEISVRSFGYIVFNQTSENAPYVFTNGLGTGITLAFNKSIALEPALDIFTSYYGFNADDRPLPVDESERYIYMVQLIIDPAFVFRIHFTKDLMLKLLAAPSFIISFPLRSWDDGNERYDETFTYLYGKLRFLEPMIGAAIQYQITTKIALEFKAKCYFPLFHIWDGEDLQFQDQMRLALSLGFQFGL